MTRDSNGWRLRNAVRCTLPDRCVSSSRGYARFVPQSSRVQGKNSRDGSRWPLRDLSTFTRDLRYRARCIPRYFSVIRSTSVRHRSSARRPLPFVRSRRRVYSTRCLSCSSFSSSDVTAVPRTLICFPSPVVRLSLFSLSLE